MQPPDSPAATGTQAPRRLLVLPPLLAIVAWQAEPTAERRLELVHALERVAELLGLGVGRLRVNAPPLGELDLDLGGGTTGAEIALRVPGDAQPIGSVRISGDHEQAAALAHALELGFMAARAGARAERATRQLMALDQAVRGISGVLDLDRGVGAAGPPGERVANKAERNEQRRGVRWTAERGLSNCGEAPVVAVRSESDHGAAVTVIVPNMPASK